VISAQAPAGTPARWLLLIHQIPPKPDYFRVRVRRRLQRMGAIPIKNSVYVLPRTEETLEDFQWLLREVASDGGDATLCEATLIEGLTSEALEEMFQDERNREYEELVTAARALNKSGMAPPEAELARLKRRLAEITSVDFFQATGRPDAERAIGELEHRSLARSTGFALGGNETMQEGTTWVTREGVKVDRIASAWLIRRFIDPKARFKFVAPRGYQPAAGERRFDMFDAEYTHEGDHCTFETLMDRFEITDRALHGIGEIVHDIDCKDERFDREETAGIARLIQGIVTANQDDAARIDRGMALFDDLYAAFRKRRP
jgi:hypothetical protein